MRKSFLWIIINLLIFSALPFISSVRAENRMPPPPSCFTGVVKWFDQQNGYGLITPQNGGADVFVHFSTITTSDNNAQKVLFPGQVVDFGMVYDDSIGRNRTTWVVLKQVVYQ